jgi:hypothetical protein
VRLVVCERLTESGQARYYFLVSNLPRRTYGTVALVEFYHERQTIEAFNKVMGNVLFLDHLRTGSITANEAVAQLSMLAYDLQSWAAHRFFAGTPYQGIAIREFVQKGLRVDALGELQPRVSACALAGTESLPHRILARQPVRLCLCRWHAAIERPAPVTP